MRFELSPRAARRGGSVPNWRGVGHAAVDDYLGAGVGSGATLLVDFDHRRVVAGGQYQVDIGGRPELVRFRRFPRGLCTRVGGWWIALSGDDLRHVTVIGRVLGLRSTTHRALR